MSKFSEIKDGDPISPTVLVVDDDVQITRVIRKTLEKDDFHCHSAHSLEDARLRIETHSYDVILLDVNLPDGSGFTLPTLNDDSAFKTPTIFLSGRTEAVDTVYALELGAEDYIKKPFNPAELTARIKSALRRNASGSDGVTHALPTKRAPRVRIGSLVFDLGTKSFTPQHPDLALLDDDARAVLECLLINSHRTVHKAELCECLGFEATIDNNRKVDTIVARVKRVLFRLGAHRHCIKYFYRKGYRINDQ